MRQPNRKACGTISRAYQKYNTCLLVLTIPVIISRACLKCSATGTSHTPTRRQTIENQSLSGPPTSRRLVMLLWRRKQHSRFNLGRLHDERRSGCCCCVPNTTPRQYSPEKSNGISSWVTARRTPSPALLVFAWTPMKSSVEASVASMEAFINALMGSYGSFHGTKTRSFDGSCRESLHRGYRSFHKSRSSTKASTKAFTKGKGSSVRVWVRFRETFRESFRGSKFTPAKASVKAFYFHENFRESFRESFRDNFRGGKFSPVQNVW